MTTLAAELSGSQKCFFVLPAALIFRVTGRDAIRYLNARLCNNIKDLPLNAGCAAAALSAQGRTELFGSVLKIAAEELLFIADGGDEPTVRATLARYKVADRVDFTYLPELTLVHVLNVSTLPLEEAHYPLMPINKEFTPFHNQAVTLYPTKRSPVMGYDVILPRTRAGELKELLKSEGARELSISEQLLGRILAKRPSYPQELNDSGIFLEAGLTHAVSFTKGCYVGQEVLEKVDSHGRLPYSIVSLKSTLPSSATLDKETLIHLGNPAGSTIGEVIGGTLDAQTHESYCFARIKSSSVTSDAKFAIHDEEYTLI